MAKADAAHVEKQLAVSNEDLDPRKKAELALPSLNIESQLSVG